MKVSSKVETINSWYKTLAVTIIGGIVAFTIPKVDGFNTTVIETKKDTQTIKEQIVDMRKSEESMKAKVDVLWALRVRSQEVTLREVN